MVNEAWRQFALSNAEVPGKSPRNTDIGVDYLAICNASNGDSLNDGQQAYAGIRQVLEGQLPNFNFEYPCHSPSQKRWFSMSVTALTAETGGVVVCHTNITDRKLAEEALQDSEEKYRLIFENAGDAIIILDPLARISAVNHAVCERLGYTRKELLSMTVAQVNTPEAACAVRPRISRIANLPEGTHLSFETVQQHKDGTAIPSEISARRIIWGGQAAIMGICRDISERKRYELELLQARDAAEAANKSKDTFLANISHELRTPLSAVIGMASLARERSSDPQQKDYLKKITSAGKHLNRLVNDLLDLAKIGAGHLEFEAVSFSLRQLVSQSVSTIRHKADEKGLQLVATIAEEIPDILVGDTMRIEQILLNLLGNAVKFTADGRIDLRVEAGEREARRICLIITVQDTGIGLRDEEIALLFKPFSQADVSITRKFGGTGLGLAICKHLAELMDGGISVRSGLGQGSTFRVHLWLALGEAGELLTVANTGLNVEKSHYHDARVLVVDDQPFNREVVAGLLSMVDIQAELVSNGQEALDLLSLEANDFDLVLMDLQMPVMDGLTATRAIRQIERLASLRIIAMTAHTMAHQRMNSIAAGMNDHIGKPFDEEVFYRVLEKWIPADKRVLQPLSAPCSGPALIVGGLPRLRGVDTASGLALLQGNEARYRQWLGVFIVQAPVALTQIREALAVGDPEPASMAAHTLRGSTGLLGMNELHARATALETAIDAAEATEALLHDLALHIDDMCAELKSKLGLDADAVAEALPKKPGGALPYCIAQLIERLDAGDGDCDATILVCLDELKDTAWAPHLRQAQITIQNFDYADAIRLLDAERR